MSKKPMAKQMKRTMFAQKGLDFVSLFAAKFGAMKVSGHRPMLREPHGASTAGGKQAVQHIIFEPQIDGDPIITLGSVNVATKLAKLRSYDCLAALHNMRFRKRAFDVDQSQYQAFFDSMAEFMRRQGMQVEIETRPPDSMEVAAHAGGKHNGTQVLLWVMAAVVVFGGAVVVFLSTTGRL